MLNIPERHVCALAARDGAGGVEVAILQLVGYAVVVAVAESVFQCELTFALVVAAEQVAIDKTRGQGRLRFRHNTAAVLALFEDDIDDTRGTAVEVTGAGVIGVFHTLDLLGFEVGQSCHGNLLAVDLQNGPATVNSDALQRHIHLQSWQPQHVEQHQRASCRLHLFLFWQHHEAVDALCGAAGCDGDGLQLLGVHCQRAEVVTCAATHGQPLITYIRGHKVVGTLATFDRECTVLACCGASDEAIRRDGFQNHIGKSNGLSAVVSQATSDIFLRKQIITRNAKDKGQR